MEKPVKVGLTYYEKGRFFVVFDHKEQFARWSMEVIPRRPEVRQAIEELLRKRESEAEASSQPQKSEREGSEGGKQ